MVTDLRDYKTRAEEQFAYMQLEGMLFTFFNDVNDKVKLRVSIRGRARYYADFELADNEHFELVTSNLSEFSKYKAMFLVEKNEEILKEGSLEERWVLQNED